jgi:hypothetical protein
MLREAVNATGALMARAHAQSLATTTTATQLPSVHTRLAQECTQKAESMALDSEIGSHRRQRVGARAASSDMGSSSSSSAGCGAQRVCGLSNEIACARALIASNALTQ